MIVQGFSLEKTVATLWSAKVSNVVYVDFLGKHRMRPEDIYLDICKEELCPEDYQELLDAIQSLGFYQTADIDIQRLADGYFKAVGKC